MYWLFLIYFLGLHRRHKKAKETECQTKKEQSLCAVPARTGPVRAVRAAREDKETEHPARKEEDL